MKIAIIGLGMVAQSDALVLARAHDVTLTGPQPDHVDAINAGKFTLADPSLPAYLAAHSLSLRATLDTHAALEQADLVLISAPLAAGDATDESAGGPCTVELESRIELAHALCPAAPLVIRSAVPVGFTRRMRESLGVNTIVVVPEFLRPDHALQDALSPRALIVGDTGVMGSRVSALMLSAMGRAGVPVQLVSPSQAEAIKHVSQALAAMQADRDGTSTALEATLRRSGALRIGLYQPDAPETLGAVQNRLMRGGACVSRFSDGQTLTDFSASCDVIVAAHLTSELAPFATKVFQSDMLT